MITIRRAGDTAAMDVCNSILRLMQRPYRPVLLRSVTLRHPSLPTVSIKAAAK